ncbi:MAG: YkgJ family cysteine cluster protein [Methanoregulaceae archaeon]|nr:YkgJ family cysteine cluster protein [Methanoregulaceae archaeon]
MKPSRMTPGTCSRCGECCRWFAIITVRQCKPHQIQYLRERGFVEEDGFFLADIPCRHLQEEDPDGSGGKRWACDIYEKRPETCRDFCGRTLSGGKRYYVPASCTMATGKTGDSGSTDEK